MRWDLNPALAARPSGFAGSFIQLEGWKRFLTFLCSSFSPHRDEQRGLWEDLRLMLYILMSGERQRPVLGLPSF